MGSGRSRLRPARRLSCLLRPERGGQLGPHAQRRLVLAGWIATRPGQQVDRIPRSPRAPPRHRVRRARIPSASQALARTKSRSLPTPRARFSFRRRAITRLRWESNREEAVCSTMQRSGGAVERRPDVVARRVVAAATGASRKGNHNRTPSLALELGAHATGGASRKTRPLRMRYLSSLAEIRS